jgi:CheY-like chemotaxis protein
MPESEGNQAVPVLGELIAAGKKVAMAGLNPAESERLSAVLNELQVQGVSLDADPSDPARISGCCALVLGVGSEAGQERLKMDFPPECPLILAGDLREILAVDSSLRLRAADFLINPWQPSQAIFRIAMAAARTERDASIRNGSSISPLQSALIADDVVTIRLVVRAALEQAGIRCWIASTGSEALRIIWNHRPQVAVLDVNMPGMNGYSVLEQIRKERLPIRVVLLTGRRDPADVGHAVKLGADDYIVKPFKPADLIQRLEALVAR